MRKCDHCGKPMYEGFYADGDTYCSEACLLEHFTQAEWDDLAEDGDSSEFYWTTWEEVDHDIIIDWLTAASPESFMVLRGITKAEYTSLTDRINETIQAKIWRDKT